MVLLATNEGFVAASSADQTKESLLDSVEEGLQFRLISGAMQGLSEIVLAAEPTDSSSC